MKVQRFVLGPISTNTYLITEANDALLIDPASKAEKLIDILGDLNLKGILLTHGHFDHIKAVDGLYEKYKCPVYLHQDDEELARDKYSGDLFGLVSYITCPITYLKEEKLNIEPFDFEVVYTPGHTEGSVIYVFDDCIFTGDTLFKGSVGRTDLKGGDARKLKDSMRIFKQFKKDYVIYPGHDETTTLMDELDNNYYLN